MIFEELLVSPKAPHADVYTGMGTVISPEGKRKEVRIVAAVPSVRSLAFVNSRIPADVLPIFYGRNTFLFQPSVRHIIYADWMDRLTQNALLLVARISLTKCVYRCVSGNPRSPHSHSYTIHLIKRIDRKIHVDFSHSAADFCPCNLAKVCCSWAKKYPPFDDLWFARILRDVESTALPDFRNTSCVLVTAGRRPLREAFGRLVGARPVGDGMWYQYALMGDEQ